MLFLFLFYFLLSILFGFALEFNINERNKRFSSFSHFPSSCKDGGEERLKLYFQRNNPSFSVAINFNGEEEIIDDLQINRDRDLHLSLEIFSSKKNRLVSLKKGTKGKNLLELWRKEIKDISRNNLFVILYDQLERKSSERAKKDNLTGCSIEKYPQLQFQFLPNSSNKIHSHCVQREYTERAFDSSQVRCNGTSKNKFIFIRIRIKRRPKLHRDG